MRSADGKRPVGRWRLQHLAILLVLAASACASPRNRIETKLVEAGLPRASAACVADRMVSDLSLAQLNAVSDAVKPGRYGKLTIGELAARLQRMDDPEIARVLTAAESLAAGHEPGRNELAYVIFQALELGFRGRYRGIDDAGALHAQRQRQKGQPVIEVQRPHREIPPRAECVLVRKQNYRKHSSRRRVRWRGA